MEPKNLTLMFLSSLIMLLGATIAGAGASGYLAARLALPKLASGGARICFAVVGLCIAIASTSLVTMVLAKVGGA